MGELTQVENWGLPSVVVPVPENYEQEERKRRLTDLVWAHVPKHLIGRTMNDGFRPLLTKFDWTSSFVLLGPTGSGKSTACVHLVAELLKRGKVNGGKDYEFARSIFWTRADVITKAGGSDEDEAAKLLHRAEWSRLMILDDIATPSKTLLGVIQQRYDRGRPMIVTSGALNPKGFSELVGGEAVTRWILECGGKRKGDWLKAK
ncbi:MAG: ATP-binding protein [Xanthomonadales bacterium]|nr:ATP-binding protein [Xanthomonadales bacterium]